MAARAILHGHLHAFYPGQAYGGPELYLLAGAFWLFGSGPTVLGAVPVLLSAVAAVLVWRIAARLTADRLLAAAVAAVVWAFPDAAVLQATREYGFRGVTMVCGLALVLVAVRVADRGGLRTADAVAGGAALGLGWWSSPEIVYFAVPAGAWLAPVLLRTGRTVLSRSGLSRSGLSRSGLSRSGLSRTGLPRSGRHRAGLPRSGRHRAGTGVPATDVPDAAPTGLPGIAATGVLGIAATAVGSLPWLWANAASGLASLRVSAYFVPAGAPGYLGRLGDVATGVFPLLLDLRHPDSGVWTVPRPLGVLLAAAVGAGLLATCGRALTRRSTLPLAAAVLAFPFLQAMVPGSWQWESGRYDTFAVPLVALLCLTVWLPDEHHHRSGRTAPHPRATTAWAAVAAAVAAAGLLTVPGSVAAARRHGPTEATASALAHRLEADGVVTGVADYWVAYTLDYLTGGRLALTVSPPSPDRFPGLLDAFRDAPASQQAWVFVTPTPSTEAEFAASPVIEGPSGLPVRAFLADTAARGIRCRTWRSGPLVVARCPTPVSFADVGLHPHP